MINTNFFKSLTVALTAFLFASCDKDYNSLGSDVIGNENFLFEKYTGDLSVKVYNQKVREVQTNNLAINQLGIYSDPIYGVTKANFVTQLTLGTLAPEFGANVVVDSVVLDVPYFSTKTATSSTGVGEYELNSIYTTNVDSDVYDPIDLKIFRNGFELNDFDPATNYTTAQKFYSNQDGDVSAQIASPMLNDGSNPLASTAFVPSNVENKMNKVTSVSDGLTPYTIVHNKTTDIESRSMPSMHLYLDKDHFRDHVINAGASNLIDNNSFKSHYKGLYFQVQSASTGSLMKLDFKKGKVIIYYKEDLIRKDANGVVLGNERPRKTLVLNMSGNTVNLFDVSANISYPEVTSPNITNGDQSIYLKGGEGTQAYVELFKDNELATLKAMNVLVNDASLTFTVADSRSIDQLPKRVYLFDADNDRFLLDFLYDTTTDVSDSKLNKSIHGGIIEEIGGIKRYKIRITEHINKILREKDTQKENVRLALVITDDINNPAYGALKTPVSAPSSTDATKTLKTFPVGAITNHMGTVLYGNNNVIPANDVKFEIYYTKPN